MEATTINLHSYYQDRIDALKEVALSRCDEIGQSCPPHTTKEEIDKIFDPVIAALNKLVSWEE